MHKTESDNLRRLTRAAVLALLILAGLALPTRAQDCSALVPGAGGPDDAATINNCLASPGFARLTAATSTNPFKLYQPIVFPQGSGKQLTGAGNNDSGSVLQPQFTCGQTSPFVAGGQYQYVIQALKTGNTNTVLSNFKLDLSQLRKSCGIKGNFAIRLGGSALDSAAGARVTSVRIAGSLYGTPDYTTGWVHGGGLLVVNSRNVVVSDNVVRNLGYTTEVGGQSAGWAGIQIANCANARVENNNIVHVTFPLQVINGSPQHGYHGDSSGTILRNNTLTGAAGINCPDCAAGRAIKLQACGLGDELPLRNLSVTNNMATNWGGPTQAIVVPSGLEVLCGVQYGTFTGNSFVGDNQASYGLEIRSSFQSPQAATHHNQFDNNTFRAGACSGCYDVFFEDDGPDQGRHASGAPSVGRKVKGTNIYSSTNYRVNRDCNQYSHAWWAYPPAQTFINRGQYLTVAAAGIRPDTSQLVTFTFKNAAGSTVLTRSFAGGNGNCVMNQQAIYLDSAYFSTPGLYKVYATYSDGNSNAVIRDDALGSIDVR